MYFKIYKKSVIVSVLIAIIVSSSLYCFANKQLAIRSAKQQESYWCWAASAVSIMSFYGVHHTQSYFVEVVKGSVVDAPATDSEVAQGLINFGFHRNLLTRALTYEEVQDEIDMGRPIYAGLTLGFWFPMGHAVVINGYNTDNTEDYIQYMDPDDGYCHWLTYDEFAGISSSSREWDGTIRRIYRATPY